MHCCSLSSSSSSSSSARDHLINTDIEMETEISYFTKAIRQYYSLIEKLLEQLSVAQAKHLTPSGFELDDSSFENESIVEGLVEKISKSLIRAKGRIIDLESKQIFRNINNKDNNNKDHNNNNRKEGPKEEIDMFVKKNICSQLAKEHQQYSLQFKKLQQAYLRKLKDRENYRPKPTPSTTLINEISDETYDDSKIQISVLSEAEANASAQEKEIINIAKSVHELSVIFREMSNLVIEQGTLLDRIDHNVATAERYMEDGLITVAQRKQTSGAKVCLILLGVLVALILFTIFFKFVLG